MTSNIKRLSIGYSILILRIIRGCGRSIIFAIFLAGADEEIATQVVKDDGGQILKLILKSLETSKQQVEVIKTNKEVTKKTLKKYEY